MAMVKNVKPRHPLDKKMGPSVVFLPWIGKNYLATAQSKRLLFLGESHYGDDTPGDVQPAPENNPGDEIDDRLLTREVILRQFDTTRADYSRYAFFTKVMRLIESTKAEAITDSYREKFWSGVCFCNFWQELLARHGGERPRPDWKDEVTKQMSCVAFFNVLAVLRPAIVISLGRELWKHLPPEGVEQHPAKSQGLQIDRWQYQIGQEWVQVLNIDHPSRFGFSPDPWRRALKRCL
jgi:hypothetical protein